MELGFPGVVETASQPKLETPVLSRRFVSRFPHIRTCYLEYRSAERSRTVPAA